MRVCVCVCVLLWLTVAFPLPLLQLVVGDSAAGRLCVYNADSVGGEDEGIVATLTFHRQPVLALSYCPAINAVVSADAMGVLEYWRADDFTQPHVKFTHKVCVCLCVCACLCACVCFTGLPTPQSDTDLYELAKRRTRPTSVCVSPDGSKFAVTSADNHIRVFHFATGKLAREFDESLGVYEAAQRAGTLKIDALDFGRRVAFVKELQVCAHLSVCMCPPSRPPCVYVARPTPLLPPATPFLTTVVTSSCTPHCVE